jgi:hypothetical protein
VEKAGFKKFVADEIELVALADRRVDVKLDVGASPVEPSPPGDWWRPKAVVAT